MVRVGYARVGSHGSRSVHEMQAQGHIDLLVNDPEVATVWVRHARDEARVPLFVKGTPQQHAELLGDINLFSR